MSPVEVTYNEIEQLAKGLKGTEVVCKRISAAVPSGAIGKLVTTSLVPVTISEKELKTIKRGGKLSPAMADVASLFIPSTLIHIDMNRKGWKRQL